MVDVGCGVGFLGIACAFLGAKKVVLTDGNHDVLAMAQQNIGYSKSPSCWFMQIGANEMKNKLASTFFVSIAH